MMTVDDEKTFARVLDMLMEGRRMPHWLQEMAVRLLDHDGPPNFLARPGRCLCNTEIVGSDGPECDEAKR